MKENYNELDDVSLEAASRLADSLHIIDECLFYEKDDPVLYHYCSPETFLEIIKSANFRYSDLSLLNDAEERVWGYKNVFLACLDRLKEGRGVPTSVPHISIDSLVKLAEQWVEVESCSQPFACCFSTDGDSLSQWRAYSRDGEGFALGINRSQLSSYAPALTLRVCYVPEEQIDMMFKAISSICSNFTVDQMNSDNDAFQIAMVHLIGRAVSFKNPAFRDEKEVRSVHMVYVHNRGDVRSLEPSGGYAGGHKVVQRPVNFQARSGKIVPYIDWPFSEADKKVISSVVLGPKCKSSPDDVAMMLSTLGYEGFQISKAGAAYR